MKCFNCGFDCRTIYPKIDGQQFVQKMCLACGWKSFPTEVISAAALAAREKRYTANLGAQAYASKSTRTGDE